MWRVSLGDTAKGLVSAVFAGAAMAVIGVFQGVFNVDTFDLWSIDWVAVAKQAANAGVLGAQGGFTGYIGTKFFSDDQKRLFGKIQLPH